MIQILDLMRLIRGGAIIIMTTETMKQNLIDSILDEGADNPYKKQLLEIMQNRKEGKLTDIKAFLLINDILVKYDFNAIISYEQKIIDERRKIEEGKTCGLVPSVPIQNPDDVTEVAIKTKTQIGRIFESGRKELVKTIGVKNLNMKDKEGNLITDLHKVSKGKQKYKADEIINQYCDIQNRPDIKQYAIQIADIYIEPLLTVFDGRGKHSSGYYIKRLTPLIIDRLISIDERISKKLREKMQDQEKHIQYTNINKIARSIGLVDEKYRNIEYDRLIEINPKFTIKMVNDFYGNANRELEKIIYKILDNLQDNHSVISYKKNFRIEKNELIKTSKGIKTVEMVISSNDDENSIIRKAQAKVLKEFNAKGLFTIYKRNQKDKFYKRVVELINNTYGFDWKSYRKQIEIQIEDLDALKELQNAYTTDISQLEHYLYESKQRLIKRLYNQSQSDYERANKKEIAEKKAAILENPNIGNEFKDLFECGLYTVGDIIRHGIIRKDELPKSYHYWESSLNTQFNLIEFFVGKRDYNFTDEELKQTKIEIDRELPMLSK